MRRVADECANVLVDVLMQDEKAVPDVFLCTERVMKSRKRRKTETFAIAILCVVGE